MKIEHKLITSNILNGAFIILIGFFAFQNMNLVLTKLRFVEIADDVNASFLAMRIAEKNYFLYHDRKALADIREKIDAARKTIEDERRNIVPAIGATDLRQLEQDLKAYSVLVEQVRRSRTWDPEQETALRAAGKQLKEFSDSITRLERRRVNDIIRSSKHILIFSFWAILCSALVIGHFISQKILRSLRQIETLTHSIAEGNFNKLEGARPKDELGSVITAINSMSEELRHREEELIQSKKLASLGVLTAGVAHELTNPLNNISMIAQNYHDLYPRLNEEQRVGFMDLVDQETVRIQKIVKNLLDFSKPKDAIPHEADINAVIQKTLMLVQNMIDVSNIETLVNPAEGLPHVFVDENQMQQVLVNLITNAVQAMPQGGKLYIGTRAGRSGRSVELTVMDTGKGIAPEYLPHIFDPFFSTKGEGGTGLGLSVSYGIIKNHRGEIRVESKVGVGTTFTIELPIWKGEGENNEQSSDHGH
jgi:two-component system NtrC family sensor kinase